MEHVDFDEFRKQKWAHDIDALKTSLGLTQKGVAQILGVRQASVNRYEAMQSEPTGDIAIRLYILFSVLRNEEDRVFTLRLLEKKHGPALLNAILAAGCVYAEPLFQQAWNNIRVAFEHVVQEGKGSKASSKNMWEVLNSSLASLLKDPLGGAAIGGLSASGVIGAAATRVLPGLLGAGALASIVTALPAAVAIGTASYLLNKKKSAPEDVLKASQEALAAENSLKDLHEQGLDTCDSITGIVKGPIGQALFSELAAFHN